jgi:hypothetical protein
MRLGGSTNLLDPLPCKPPRMHRLTYWRLLNAAMAAQERSLALDREWLRTRYGITLGPP